MTDQLLSNKTRQQVLQKMTYFTKPPKTEVLDKEKIGSGLGIQNSLDISNLEQVLLPQLPYVFRQTGLSKQCGPRSEPQNAASHQGLICLPLIQQFLDTASGSKLYLF